MSVEPEIKLFLLQYRHTLIRADSEINSNLYKVN